MSIICTPTYPFIFKHSDCERKEVAQLVSDPAATELLTDRLVKASLEAVQEVVDVVGE